jgi:hypothetical protein
MIHAPQLLRIVLVTLFINRSVCAWARQPAAQRASPNLSTHAGSDENSSEEDLILGFRGKSKDQIIVPDQSSTEHEQKSVWRAAELLQTAFGAHGVRLETKKEPEADQELHSFYLGATNFAVANGCGSSALGSDSYMHKVVGHHIIIRGDDAPDTLAGKRGRPKETPLPHEGTLFGTAEFLLARPATIPRIPRARTAETERKRFPSLLRRVTSHFCGKKFARPPRQRTLVTAK